MSTCLPPPQYSLSGPCPTYSSTPHPTERTLQHSPRRSHTPPTGVYIRRARNVTLLLLNQEEDVEHPSIGRGGLLTGSVLIHNTNSIKSVVLKVDGMVENAPIPGTCLVTSVLKMTQTLYSCEKPSTASPRELPFACRFPRALRHEGRQYPLPPTFNIPFDDSGNFVKCTYRVTAVVASARRHASFLTRNESISFELNYRPRTRPSQPMIFSPSLFDTVKHCPEEWAQLPSLVTHPDKSPLICDLFAPSVGVFCVDEVVPFHLQLSGAAVWFPHIHQFFTENTATPHIRVYLCRQVSADIGFRMTKKALNIGEGTLRLLCVHQTKGTGHLNWEGEVRCRDPRSVVGSFECGSILVQDALVVEIEPPSNCALKHTIFGYTIKLTTDRRDEDQQT